MKFNRQKLLALPAWAKVIVFPILLPLFLLGVLLAIPMSLAVQFYDDLVSGRMFDGD